MANPSFFPPPLFPLSHPSLLIFPPSSSSPPLYLPLPSLLPLPSPPLPSPPPPFSHTAVDPLTQNPDFILVSKFVKEATSTKVARSTCQRGDALSKEELTRLWCLCVHAENITHYIATYNYNLSSLSLAYILLNLITKCDRKGLTRF